MQEVALVTPALYQLRSRISFSNQVIIMPNSEEASQKVSNDTLPYKTDDQDILKLIEAIKRKPDNEKAIKEIYNKTNFENSRKALEVLGILDGRLDFSSQGKELAVERDDSQRERLFLQVFLRYPPYGHFLESVSQANSLSTTDTKMVQDYWWKHNYGSSGNNREDGVVTFGKLCQLAGLGKFVPGRKGLLSRIEWKPEAKALIDSACNSHPEEQTVEEQSIESISTEEASTSDSIPLIDDYSSIAQTFTSEKVNYTSQPQSYHPTPKAIPNISVSADMSNWETSKIITFFKCAYGIFDDNTEPDLPASNSQGFSESSDGSSDS